MNYYLHIVLFSISIALSIYAIFRHKWTWIPYLLVLVGMLFIGMMMNYHMTLVPGWERP